MKNDNNLGNKKRKKINKIKEELARLREKLSASENKQPLSSLKPKSKKIQAKTKQAKSQKFQVIEAQSKPESQNSNIDKTKTNNKSISSKTHNTAKTNNQKQIFYKAKHLLEHELYDRNTQHL